MKEQDQIRALAELDDFEVHSVKPYRWATHDGQFADFKGEQCLYVFPCYLHSYDVILPLIQKQSHIGITQFVDFLCEKMLDDHYDGSDYISQSDIGVLFRATPAQLCEALLRATGKWTE